MAVLAHAVLVLAQVPFTTTVAAQMHGSLAATKRRRPEYGMETLTSRSFTMRARHLFPPDTGVEKRLRQTMRAIQHVVDRQPRMVHDRTLIYKHVSETANGARAACAQT